MVNFIPLKQSEDLLPTFQLGGGSKDNAKNGGFKEIFESISKNSSEVVKDKVGYKKDATKTKESEILQKISYREDTSSNVMNKEKLEVSQDEIVEKINSILSESDISEEALSSLMSAIMAFFNNGQKSDLSPEKTQELNIMLGSLKEKFNISINKLNSDDLKQRVIDTLSQAIDKLTITSDVIANSKKSILEYKNILNQISQSKMVEGKESKINISDFIKIANEELNSKTEDVKAELDNDGGNSSTKFELLNIKNDSNENPKNNNIETKHIEVKELKDILKVVDIVEAGRSSGVKKLTVQLTPEHLGKLEIQLTDTGGKITAKIFTDNEHARYMLLTSSDQIRNQLENKGIVVENMEFGFMMANEDKDNKSNKHDDKNGFKLGGAINESDAIENVEDKGLYA